MAKVKRNFITNVFLNISIFRIVYLCTLFFGSLCFTEVFANGVKYAMLIWGFILIYYYYIKPVRYLEIMYARWLVGFIGASLVTAVLHLADNFLQNIVLLCHVIICFFILYGMHTERNKRRKKWEFYVTSVIVLLATTGIMIISLISLFWGEQNIKFFMSNYHMVIYENRFTGIFTNPNLLAFYGVVAVFFAHILSKSELYSECGIKKSLPNWFLIICIAINVVGVFLSDSNGSLLLLACYVIGYFIYISFRCIKLMNIKKIFFGAGMVVISAMIIVGALIGLRICSNKVVSMALSASNAESQSQVVDPAPNGVPKSEVVPDKNNDKMGVVTFAHKNENLDSGRLALLQQATYIFYNNPIMGVGKENIVLYGEKLLDKGLKYSDLHNGYLTILVSNGLVGFIIFIGFAVSLCRHCVKSLFFEERNLIKSPFVCLFAFIFAYCIYAVIEKTLLLEHTYMVVIFWYVLGYASCYMKKYNHIDEKFDFKVLFNKDIDTKDENIDIIDKPTEIAVEYN